MKLKLQHLGHLMRRVDSLEKTLMLAKIEGKEDKVATENEMVGWHHRLDRHEFEQTLGVSEIQGSLVCRKSMGSQRVRHHQAAEQQLCCKVRPSLLVRLFGRTASTCFGK